MYRTRVMTMRGVKVYAGGKWLTCIGNAPIRVGDYVWTDGRCVYGNVLESGNPYIATLQNIEGIPIMASVDSVYHFYSFENKLKTIVSQTIPAPMTDPFKQMLMLNDKNKADIFLANLEEYSNPNSDIYGQLLDAEYGNGTLYTVENYSYFIKSGVNTRDFSREMKRRN